MVKSLDPRAAPQKLKILSLQGEEKLKHRLADLGFFPGVQLTYLGRGPFQGPHLFEIDFVVFALREEEARCLNIELLP